MNRLNKIIVMIFLIVIIIFYRYIKYSPNVKCKDWDKIINSDTIIDKDIYEKKNKNIGLLINCFGNGHLTQADTFYKILKKIGYRVNIIVLFSNKNINTEEYYFKDEEIININVKINEKNAGELDTFSIFKYLYYNLKNNYNKVNQLGIENNIDLWISFFAPVYNTQKKMLVISRQIAHKNSLLNNSVLNYFISYNLIHVSLLDKNIHSDYWIPSLIDNKKIRKKSKNICVAYYSFEGPFINILKKIANNNPEYKIYLFKNKKFDNLPKNIIVKNISKIEFRKYLGYSSCVLCTSGNELIQECVYNYIPVATIPSNNKNWEQIENFNFYCNKLNYSEEMKENLNLNVLSNKNVKDIGDKLNKSINNISFGI